MSETYQIIFVKAGDGSPAAKKGVAEKIANATKTPVERMLKQIEAAPFIYKKGLPKSKAEAIAATLNKFGAVTEVNAEPGTSDGVGAGAPGLGAPGAPAGFDFGGAPSASGTSGGFGFSGGTPAPGGGGFGFGGSSGASGEDFKIEQPTGDFGFGAPASGGSSSSGASGFNFSADAAVSTPAHKAPTSEVAVERNTDFMPTAPTPPKPSAKKGASGTTVTCPRCNTEQPQANECASCGVVMSKAGTGGEAQAPGARPRAKVRTAAVAKKSSALPIVIGVLVLAVALVGAYIVGAFNPVFLSMAAGRDPLLKSYGVTIAKPQGGIATAVVANAAKAKELEEGFATRSQHIEQEIARLATLADVAALDAGEQALRPEIEAYNSSPANEVLEHARKAIASYYSVKAVGLGLNGTTYMPVEQIALAGASNVQPLLNADKIRRDLQDARAKVTEQQAARLAAEHRESVNVSLSESFDGALGERWQKSPGATTDNAGGHLRLVATPSALAQAPRVALPEPLTDYVVEVKVFGSVQDGTRLGLTVMQDAQAFVGIVKAKAPKGETAQVITQGGDGINAPLGKDVRFKLKKKGPYYIFFSWDAARGDWAQVNRLQPAWNDALPRTLGLTGFGGGATAEFDDFVLTVAP